jgi:hypothetical protein
MAAAVQLAGGTWLNVSQPLWVCSSLDVAHTLVAIQPCTMQLYAVGCTNRDPEPATALTGHVVVFQALQQPQGVWWGSGDDAGQVESAAAVC